jgi:hypothetical protein
MYHPSSGSGPCFTLKKIQQKKKRGGDRKEKKRKEKQSLTCPT